MVSYRFLRLSGSQKHSQPPPEIHYWVKCKAAKVKIPLAFLLVLGSEFSCQIRWQLWEEGPLICIHVIEVMLSVLTICREFCLPVTYSGIQFEPTTAYLIPQMLLQ